MKETSFAVWIPIKKGSKRCPEKNVLEFNGEPLYSLTLAVARKLKLPIYITTDWELEGVEDCTIIPEHYAGETKVDTAWKVSRHWITEDNVILMLVTTPLRRVDNILRGLYHYQQNDCKKAVVEVKDDGVPTGSFYIFPRNKWLWDNELFLIWTNQNYSSDIDELFQFRIAEAIARGDYTRFL